MPYTVADVDRHIKGLGPKQKRAWVHIANGVLDRCTGDEKKCAASAIQQANGAAQKIKEATELFQSESLDPDTLLSITEAILRRSASDDGVRQALQVAIKAKYTNPENGVYSYPWVRDVFHTTDTNGQVIYEVSGSCYQADYTLTVDDGGDYTAEIGPETEVDVAYVPMSDAREGARGAYLSNEYMELVERAVRPDGTTRIKVIKPGWGSSGYYQQEALQRDGGRAYPKGTKMFWNHPTAAEDKARPERDLRDLAAELTEDAKWDGKGPKGPGLYAHAKVFSQYAKHIEELAPHIGVSIRGTGQFVEGEAEGRKGKIITALGPGRSIDFVTAAGAGGEILSLFESARGSTHEPDDSRLNDPAPAPVEEGGRDMALTPEEITAIVGQLREAIKPEMEAVTAESRAMLARITEGQRLTEARDIAAAELRVVRLPDPTKARIVADVSLRAPIKEGAIDREAYISLIKEAAKTEAQYIASVTPHGVYGNGGSDDLFEAEGSELVTDGAKFEEALTDVFSMMSFSEKGAAIAARGHVN